METLEPEWINYFITILFSIIAIYDLLIPALQFQVELSIVAESILKTTVTGKCEPPTVQLYIFIYSHK